MKTLPALFLLSFLFCFSSVFSQQGKVVEQTKEQAKLQRQAVKDAEKRRKREEKERLKYPASVQISGAADQIGALIVQHMNSLNYQIVEEGKYRIVFSQEVAGFRGALYGGLVGAQGPPLRILAFTITQLGDTSTVSVDISLRIRKAFGRVDRVDLNKNREWRSDVDSFLGTLKYRTELRADTGRPEVKIERPPAVVDEKFHGVTLRGFEQLKDGMDYATVVRVLGSDGVAIENPVKTSVADSVTTYQWKVPRGSGFAIVIVMFKNDRLLHKLQSGLD